MFSSPNQLCISEKLLSQYYEVLARPKFSKYQDFFIRAEALLVEIESKAIKFIPRIKLELISDEDDNMVLELAHQCLADFVITGITILIGFGCRADSISNAGTTASRDR